MTHPYHEHAEHKKSHARVNHILKHEPADMKQHMNGGGYSRSMSKAAAVAHEDKAPGRKAVGRFARGGRAGKHIDGDSTASNLAKWSGRASANSYSRGGGLPTAGAQTGVARLAQFKKMKREGK